MADEALIAKVKETLEAFRPQLNADGGDMEFINIDDENKVHLQLQLLIQKKSDTVSLVV